MKSSLEKDDIEAIATRVAEMLASIIKNSAIAKDVIFNTESLAAYLGVKPKWVYEHTHTLPHVKLDGLLRFRKKDIDTMLEKQAIKTSLK